MKRNKPFAIVMALVMMLSIFPVAPLMVYADDVGGGRAEFGGYNGTELFLGGKYIELGISNWGDFGTEGDKPSNFFGTSVRSNLGMSADHDGFGIGENLPVDYYLPGTMEERFAVGYQIGEVKVAKSNSALMRDKQIPTQVFNTSQLENGVLSGLIVSTWEETMEIRQVIRFKENDKFYRNDVTITNLSDENWDGARYMRSLDPDNTVDQGGSYETANTVTHTIEEDGIAVVEAKTISNRGSGDKVYDAFHSNAPIFFYSSDPRAKASVFGFTNRDPYDVNAYDKSRTKGVEIVDDTGITMTWDSGALAPNESKSFTYYTSLDERDFDEVIGDIELDEEASTDLVEAETNDGTVTGNKRVHILGATLIDSIDANQIRINNLPAGLGFDVVRISDTELDFKLTGEADKHSKEFTVDNLSVTIGEDNLIGTSSDLTTETFSLTFIDPAMLNLDKGIVMEEEKGNGEIEETLSLFITNGKFATDIVAGDIEVHHLPDGLSTSLVRISDKELRFSFDGKATVTEDVYTAFVSVVAEKLVGSPTDLSSHSFKIDFHDKEPYMVVQSPVYESDLNDGGIGDALVLELKNGTIDVTIVTDSVYTMNWPAGLEVGDITFDSGSNRAIISIAGQADSHDSANSVHDAQVTIAGIPSNTFSILFRSPPPSITAAPDVLHDAGDGSVAETLTVILKNGTFIEEITSGVTVNNLPEGLSFNVVRMNDTQLDIQFTGQAIKQSEAAAFASVTVDAFNVKDAVAPITSNHFEFQLPEDASLVRALVDMANLTWDTIRENNIEQVSVTSNVYLPELGDNESIITWTSTDKAVISLDGIVTRPSFKENDEEVTLTAKIRNGTNTFTKEFNLIVRKRAGTDEQSVTEDADRITWDMIRQENETMDQVTFDLVLPSEGEYGSRITWTTSHATVIDTEGNVIRPQHIDGDQAVTLIATIAKGDVTHTKEFILTVKGTSLVDIPQDKLDVGIVYAPGDTETSVTKNVFLTTIGHTGSDITWTSNRVDIITNQGRVNRPGPDEEDVIVMLTAILSDPDNPGASSTKTFTLTVKKLSDQEAVDEAARSLGIQEAATFVEGDIWESVTEEFLLLETGKYSTDITWTSNQPSVIGIESDGIGTTGKVNRQDEETKVILTATFSRNGKTSTKQYLLVVKGIGVSKDGAIRQPTSRTAELSVNHDGNPLQQGVTILRTRMSDGVNIDTIIVDDDDMYNLVEPINPNDPDAVNRRVVITHVDDPAANADEIAIEIPATAVYTLAGRNISLDIVTDLATIHLDEGSIRQLEAMGTDLYFRIIPVRDVQGQQAFQTNAVTNGSRMLSLASKQTVKVLGMPRGIETNYSGVNTKIRIPMSEFVDQIPVQSSGDRDAFLDKIRIYVEHSDGENVVYSPLKMVYTAEGEPDSVEFQIDKFSTFQIIQITDKVSSGSHGGSLGGPIVSTDPLDDGDTTDDVTTLTGKKLRELQNEDGDIVVETDFGTWKLGAGSIDLDEIGKQFDKEDMNPDEIEIHVGITKADKSYVEGFILSAEQRQVQPVGEPIRFDIEAVYEGQTRPVTLRGWAEYTVPVPEGLKITTGVLYKDGEIHHQPTYVTIEDGRYYATINSLENGVFGLIWNPKEFPDVEKHWSKQDVNDMGSRLVASGKTDVMFDAQRPITRSEFTALIVRALGIVNHDTQSAEFSDVSPHIWFEHTMNVAIEHGLIFGYPDGTFKPNNSIERQEAMAIISRAMGITELMVSSNQEQSVQLLQSFKDSARIAEWAVEDVKMNLSAGIIVGRNEWLSPNENITRAEAAAAIRRLLIQSGLINP